MSSHSKNSGKFVLRIPPELHQKLKATAQTMDQSLNQTCVQLIRAGMESSSESLTIQKNISSLIETYSPFGLLGMVLFGSVARGTSTASSDIDLLLVLDSKTPITRSLYRLWDHEKIALHFVHVPELTPEKNISGFWLEIALDGKVIWEKEFSAESSLVNLIAKIKTEIFSGQYQRKQAHGHPYWLKRERE